MPATRARIAALEAQITRLAAALEDVIDAHEAWYRETPHGGESERTAYSELEAELVRARAVLGGVHEETS